MAETEDRCRAARGASQPARDRVGSTVLGIAAAVVFLLEAAAAGAQEPPAPAPGGAAPGTSPSEAPPAGGPASYASGPTNAGQAQGPAEGAGREWTITPFVAATESFTDNALSTPTQRRADLISTLSPSIFINGASSRLTGTFSYTPQFIKYADVTSQDQVLQNLLGNGTLTAIPDLLFFDANAGITNVARSGGRGLDNTTPIATSQNTQTIVYSGSPYLRFRFGDAGTAELRYFYGQTVFQGNTGATINTLTGQSLGSISNSTQQDESAKYSTGEAFNRLQLGVAFDNATVRSPDSALNSRDIRGVMNGRYSITRSLQALFAGGYEKLTYEQQSQLNFSGPTWNFGARFAPRDDREIVLTYGKSQGRNSFNGTANYALTAGATVSASYSEQTTTQQQQILQNLAVATQITPGVTINSQTGLPQFLANPNLALQNSIIRTSNFQAGLQLVGLRNRYTFTFNHSDQSGLSAGALNQTTNGGLVSWSRDLSPNTSGALTASYSSTNSPGAAVTNNSTDAATLAISFTFALGPSLDAGASYAVSRQTGGVGGSVLVDLVSVTLRKTF